MGDGTGGFVVGCGISDITGEIAQCGLLGYGKAEQIADGLHLRLRARAFVFADAADDGRLLLVVCELPLMFESVHEEVLRRLRAVYGDRYTAANVMLSVTHTHCGPGGYSGHLLYNSNTHGFRPLTFAAIVDGILEAVELAHRDLGPATLTLAHGELTNASVNRSPQSFARNPEADRAFFPLGIDPQTTVVRIERDGRTVGAVNWFPTHGTSMTNHNTLVGGDNKGYAAYHWERMVEGVDYHDGERPALIAAFAQTNTGDMSPNLNLAPGSGPTDDEFENTRIIGQRQADAAAGLAGAPGRELTGGVDSRTTYVDLSRIVVGADYTGDGREHRTSAPSAGAAAFAGTDEGPGYAWFRQGVGANRFWDGLSRHAVYRIFRRFGESQAPKGVVVPGGLNRILPLVQERVPVQLHRVGQLYLIGIPGEATIVAGLRLRRTVAAIVGADVRDVLVAGYSNAYIHYITTPEEYAAQRYEGGSTLFGRWELGAIQQTVAGLATALVAGRPVALDAKPSRGARPGRSRLRKPVDEPPTGCAYGDVVEPPAPSYRPGQEARVVFAGAHPNNDLRRGESYLLVQRAGPGDEWVSVAYDDDWSTKFRWARQGKAASRVTITWEVPDDAVTGRYRIVYFGTSRAADGKLHPFEARTPEFEVSAG